MFSTTRQEVVLAFLANFDLNSYATVTFRGLHYNLPPWSISILPDCKNTVFNTAKVGAQSSQARMSPVWQNLPWKSYNEETASYDDNSITTVGLMEQINITRDVSDYLWYSTDVKIGSNEAFLRNGNYPQLTVQSAGHALHVFINGQLSGTAYGGLDNPKLTFSGKVRLRAGVNKITLLSIAVGYYGGTVKASGSCGECNYAGYYNEKKCQSNCGEASQRWYHVPRSWLNPSQNFLVVFELMGGDPSGISLVKRTVGSVCADISEWQPNMMSYMMQTSGKIDRPLRPKAHLQCAPGQKMTSIKFASFGSPQGVCGSYRERELAGHIGATELAAYALIQTIFLRFANGILDYFTTWTPRVWKDNLVTGSPSIAYLNCAIPFRTKGGC